MGGKARRQRRSALIDHRGSGARGASLQDQATVGVKFGETATVSLIGTLDAGGYASVDCKSVYTDGTAYGKNLVIAATKVGDIYHSY